MAGTPLLPLAKPDAAVYPLFFSLGEIRVHKPHHRGTRRQKEIFCSALACEVPLMYWISG